MNKGQIKLLANLIIVKIVMDAIKDADDSLLGSYAPLNDEYILERITMAEKSQVYDLIENTIEKLQGNHIRFNKVAEMVQYVKNK